MASSSRERRQCLAVLCRWQPDGDEHLDALVGAASSDPAHRPFVQNLCYGVIRNLSLLDHWISLLADGGKKIDLEARVLLRMGLYEIFYTRTPDHAAVNEAVGMAGRARGFVNALLRRALREREELEQAAADAPLHIRYSHPRHLVSRWVEQFGAEEAEALCRWNQEPAPVFVRENRLKTVGGKAELGRIGEPLDGYPGFWRVRELPREALQEGRVYAQDPSTTLACRLLAPKPGERVLDACAAPGGKTALLAEMMENRGKIIATDPKPARLERLSENIGRLGVTIAEARQAGWGGDGGEAALPEGGFDRVLADVPCSNSGVLRRRADARWRIGEATFARLAELQASILDDVARQLRPGGRMAYSTCSLDGEENRGVVDRFLSAHPGWRLLEEKALHPVRDGFDGAYAALLEAPG